MKDRILFDKNAVVTLQGGGLYGLTLLGQISAALKEVENVLAIAGTSAGAIIAALIWAGWSPEALRNRLAQEAKRRHLHSLPGDFVPPEKPFDFKAWTALTGDIASTYSRILWALCLWSPWTKPRAFLLDPCDTAGLALPLQNWTNWCGCRQNAEPQLSFRRSRPQVLEAIRQGQDRSRPPPKAGT